MTQVRPHLRRKSHPIYVEALQAKEEEETDRVEEVEVVMITKIRTIILSTVQEGEAEWKITRRKKLSNPKT